MVVEDVYIYIHVHRNVLTDIHSTYIALKYTHACIYLKKHINMHTKTDIRIFHNQIHTCLHSYIHTYKCTYIHIYV